MKLYRAVVLSSCLFFSFLFHSCQKEFLCEWCKENFPPVARAGADQVIILPKDSITLNGSASTDDGTIVSYRWKKLNGPVSSNILKPNDSNTVVKALTEGVYDFELTVTDDGGLADKDTIQVRVNQPGANFPPVACAGSDLVITLPVSKANLNGSCSTDPDNNIVQYEWTKISGPSFFSFVSAGTAKTQVTGLVEGLYGFALKVTDAGGLFSMDTVMVSVIVLNCNLSLPPVNSQLLSIGTLTQPRTKMAVAAAGNKILYAGGITNTGIVSSRVDIYDISTNTWSNASLSVGRYYIGSVTVGDKIFFAGGETGFMSTGVVSTIDIYDASTNTWSVANLSIPGHSVAVAAVGDKVLFAGGMGFGNGRENRVDIYDLAINDWYFATLNTLRAEGHSAITVGNKVYIAGGFNPSLADVIDIFDNASGLFSSAVLSEPKANLGTVAVGDKIYWAGGKIGNTTTTCKLEIRDVNTGDHTIMSMGIETMFNVNTADNIVVQDGKIIIPFQNYFHLYDTQTNAWSRGTFPNSNYFYTSFFSYNNVLYVSGSLPGDNLETVWKMNF
ncbi:MAG TPA: kelch repeat-containing protein [Ferruginibacter sp.]|nr:kelch repeat-containing protein [Ferruginibacter sp.]